MTAISAIIRHFVFSSGSRTTFQSKESLSEQQSAAGSSLHTFNCSVNTKSVHSHNQEVKMGSCHSKPPPITFTNFFPDLQSEVNDAKSDVVSLSTEIWNWDVSEKLPAHRFRDNYAALIDCGEGTPGERARDAVTLLNRLEQQVDYSLVSGYDALVHSAERTGEYDQETLRDFCRGPLTRYVSTCDKVLNI